MSKELEALEELRNNYETGAHLFDYKYLDIIEKALKGWEIIRRTNLDLDYVRINPNFHQYRVRLKNSFMDLEITEEEFKLLKELLWNTN